MKKLQLLLLMLLAWPIGMLADVSRDSLVSNYGGWVNLTDGYTEYKGNDHQKMEATIDGNIVHLIWMDHEADENGIYNIWYRRSTDLGKTWEDAKVVATTRYSSAINGDGGNKLMSASEGHVYITVIDRIDEKDAPYVVYLLKSDDGGATFSEPRGLMNSGTDWWDFHGVKIDSDGPMVVLGAAKSRESQVFYQISNDYGETFMERIEQYDAGDPMEFMDLHVNNGQWSALTWSKHWNYTTDWGPLTVTTYDGTELVHHDIGKQHSDGNYYIRPTMMKGYNGDELNYHPQMVLDGNTIHVMYRGNPGTDEEDIKSNQTLYSKSTDFGSTWSEPVILPESEGGHGMIAARGQNIYILTTRKGLHTLYYSNDGGSTWDYQTQATWNDDRLNTTRSYWVTIDPNDATGKHAYLTGNRYYYAETKDGFKTLCKNFVLGDKSWVRTYYNNNHALKVLLDKDGLEHWFLQYQHPVNVVTETGSYTDTDHSSRDILYRRNEAEPAPSTKNMALNLVDSLSPTHRVAIPMTPSLNIKEAMTVELWVQPDILGSFQVAATTENSGSQEGSTYTGGWCINLDAPSFMGTLDGYHHIRAALCTEKATDGVVIWLENRSKYQMWQLNKWHHIALTYDSKVKENNAHLYVDGMLVATGTGYGNILQGNNPIVLGRKGSSTSKGLLDNFIIWSRALTQEEIRDHIYNAPDGQDEDCRLLLTFDGTLKDQSQYGNDALGLLDVELTEHDGIRVPHPNFVMAKDNTGSNVTLTDVTTDGQVAWWVWDDSYYGYRTSTDRNVKLQNLNSGVYNVTMAAVGDDASGYNACATVTQQLSISGITQVSPDKAGNTEGFWVYIKGGFSKGTYTGKTVLLLKGDVKIEGKWATDYSKMKAVNGYGIMDLEPRAYFDLTDAEPGLYDVVVDTDTLRNGFTVEKGELPKVWMSMTGSGRQLINKWKNHTITYGNKANVPAYNTPIYFCISDNHGNTDVTLNFEYDYCNDKAIAQEIGEYVKVPDGKGDSVRVYSFLIPYIGPNTQGEVSFNVQRKNYGTGKQYVNIAYAIGEPWGPNESDASGTRGAAGTRGAYGLAQAECMIEYLATGVFESSIDALPLAGCVYNSFKTGYQGVSDNESRWSTFGSNFLSTFLSCGSDLFPVTAVGKCAFFMGSMIWNLVSNYNNAKQCLDGNGGNKDIECVSSYDPNEMIGPSIGNEDEHYIKPITVMPYTITYENKSTASAPANEVFISDTLDVKKYDLSTFNFSSYGWADKKYIVSGTNTKEFSADIPFTVSGYDMMVRVSGQFDEEKGIAKWSFVSLEKDGKELDDVMNGFLLPNNDDHVGEGFVSFSIEHLPNPATGTTVSNKATIVFDANAPIETNTFVNTFDTDYPTSEIKSLFKHDDKMVLTYVGNDNTSGVGSYDLYVFKNGGEAEELALGVTDNQYAFAYDPDASYAFCVIATDNVGWKEAKDIKPEVIPVSESVTITMSKYGKTTFCGSKGLDFSFSNEVKAFVATGFDKGENTIWMTRVKDVPAGVPVMIKGVAEKSYEIPVTSGGTSYYANMFKGNDGSETMVISPTEEDGKYVNYYMSKGQFVSVNGTANITANKCYLRLPATFEAEATGADQSVKIATSGKSSFAAPFDLDFTSLGDDVRAFTATGYDASTKTVWLSRVKKVQQGEGLMLKGTASETYAIPSVGVQAIYMNLIVGNTSGDAITVYPTSEDGEWTNYYLKGGTYMSVSGNVSIGNNKSYLQLPTSMLAGARGEDAEGMQSEYTFVEMEMESMPIIFASIGNDGDGTTGIKDNNRETITNDRDDQWYTLGGQRISKPTQKGLYIHNGRKVVVR